MTGVLAFLGRVLRGVRLVESAALLVLLAMVLGVYLVKAKAGRERGDITAVEGQIAEEQHRLRLLRAEVAHLEEPARIERLSAMLGLGPTNAKRERSAAELPQIARESLLSERGAAATGGGGASTQTGYQGPSAPVVASLAAAGKAGGPQ